MNGALDSSFIIHRSSFIVHRSSFHRFIVSSLIAHRFIVHWSSFIVMTRVTRIDHGTRTIHDDVLAIEEPLEIRVGERPLSVTLRTPGDDFDLAAGFLAGESIVRMREDIEAIRHWGSPNVVRADLRDGVKVDWQRLQRHFYSTSSCGVCGKVSIDALRVHAQPVTSEVRIARDVINALPDQLRAEQKAFDATGAIHAAGIFSNDGTLLRLREDVGRHNAVDKVVGSCFLDGTPLDDCILLVSGRTSFEIVQKAIVARVPVLAAVGAPSSLAVELAREFGVTLLGFVRDGRFNLYSGDERLV
ncbi:MAG TPA: formate dehydrogenase accessory sulfurtransferase FdhD [Thermoanaerobaculia bacterium]|nr:formate dehydrogenase accessory sulfurtransferase FdhD [Thermoanaerobaculia bacterium]